MSLLLNIEPIDGMDFSQGDNSYWYVLKAKPLTCKALYLNNQSIGDEKKKKKIGLYVGG